MQLLHTLKKEKEPKQAETERERERERERGKRIRKGGREEQRETPLKREGETEKENKRTRGRDHSHMTKSCFEHTLSKRGLPLEFAAIVFFQVEIFEHIKILGHLGREGLKEWHHNS